MRQIKFTLAILGGLGISSGYAQSNENLFESYQCDPISCSNILFVPVDAPFVQISQEIIGNCYSGVSARATAFVEDVSCSVPTTLNASAFKAQVPAVYNFDLVVAQSYFSNSETGAPIWGPSRETETCFNEGVESVPPPVPC